jgi:hypothetical protein
LARWFLAASGAVRRRDYTRIPSALSFSMPKIPR